MSRVQPVATRNVALLAVLLWLVAVPVARAGDFDFDMQGRDCYCTGVGTGADGSIFGADWQRERVVKWSPSGEFEAAFFRPQGADVAFHPQSVAEAPGGELVVATREGTDVLSAQGTFLRTLDPAASTDVAVDGLGIAYAAVGDQIHKVAVAGGPVQVLSDPAWLQVSGLSYDPRSGHLLFADANRGTVTELRTDGSTVRAFGSSGTGAGQLNRPGDVVVGPDGSAYVTEYSYPGPPIKKFDAAGSEAAAWGQGSSLDPEGLAISGDHLVFALGTDMRALDLVHPTAVMVGPQGGNVYAGALARFGANGYTKLAFGTIKRFDWDFDGDGVVDLQSGPATYPIPSHRYSEPGTYRVTVTATADSGGTSTATQTLTVTRAGVALSASPDPVLTGAPVTLDASKPVLPETGVDDARWDLDGDGTYETDGGASATLQTTFATAGTHRVGVRLAREGGTVDEGTLDVAVRPKPPAGPVGVSINDGARYTNDPRVTLDVTWPAGVASLTAANDGGFRAGRTLPATAHVAWKLDETGPERLPKTAYVRFDAGTQTFQDDIVLDQTDPAIRSAQVSSAAPAGARAAARRAHRYRVRMRASDRTSGVAYVQFATRRSRPAKRVRYHSSLSVRGTTRPLYVRVWDRAGNPSRWRRLATRRA